MQLPQGELDGDFHEDVHWFTASSRRAEPPLPDGSNGPLIESGAAALKNRYLTNGSVSPDDDLENHVAGDSPAARLVCVLRFHLAEQSRRLDSAAGPERSAAGASAGAIADAGAEAFTAADTLTGPRSASGPCALAFARVASALHHAIAVPVAARGCDDRRNKDARGERFWRFLNGLRRRSGRRYGPRRFHLDAAGGEHALGRGLRHLRFRARRAFAFHLPRRDWILQSATTSAATGSRRDEENEACWLVAFRNRGRLGWPRRPPQQNHQQDRMNCRRSGCVHAAPPVCKSGFLNDTGK
jgi:hypothetical protein